MTTIPIANIIKEDTIPVATAININSNTNPNPNPNSNIELITQLTDHHNISTEIYNILRYKKIIQLFALFDLLLCFLSGLYDYNILFLIIFPIIGYQGAKHYNISFLTIYSFFIFCIIGGKLAYIIKSNLMIGNYIFNIISLLIETWLFSYICTFSQLINKLSDDDKVYLQTESNYTHNISYLR